MRRLCVVAETAKVIPKELLEYHVFGGHDNSHYGHYDLLGHRNVSVCVL